MQTLGGKWAFPQCWRKRDFLPWKAGSRDESSQDEPGSESEDAVPQAKQSRSLGTGWQDASVTRNIDTGEEIRAPVTRGAAALRGGEGVGYPRGRRTFSRSAQPTPTPTGGRAPGFAVRALRERGRRHRVCKKPPRNEGRSRPLTVGPRPGRYLVPSNLRVHPSRGLGTEAKPGLAAALRTSEARAQSREPETPHLTLSGRLLTRRQPPCWVGAIAVLRMWRLRLRGTGSWAAGPR